MRKVTGNNDDNKRRFITVDGNEAAASVAHRLSEVIAIYPITPSSPMGELSDEWSAAGNTNIWGAVPDVTEMQSEGGAAGAVHGALQGGALTTTFTSSQGLLLMIPNMYKIAGELTPFVMHVAARTIATHALSIFADHSDVMACRQTGFAMLASGSVQEAQDFACIAQRASLESRIPFIHFFDGFRTSHEISKIEALTDDDLRSMIESELVIEHRKRALTPDMPVIRGTAQNPDTFFQAREACNSFYMNCPSIVEKTMESFHLLTGRRYRLFDYVGHPEAERIIVIMGSGAETVHETVEWMEGRGEKVGLVKVRLYRPFSIKDFVASLPGSVKAVAVLDRTKEPGATGEPLYLDVVTALREAFEEGISPFKKEPRIVGGRYGLSSKEFTPAMVRAVFDELSGERPRNHFTLGIEDDMTGTSLDFDHSFDIEADDVVRAAFFGLGSDGTVGANKNSIKIIGEETPNFAQGYFVYDSKKAGGITISHLRFGPRPIRSTYLVRSASFVACHQSQFLEKYDMLDIAAEGAVFLLNTSFGPSEIWDRLPREVQEAIVEKGIIFYVIDAYRVAKESGMGGRINTVMQTCFFAISGVLARDEAIGKIKEAIEKSYGKKGKEVVEKNFRAVDAALADLHEVEIPSKATAERLRPSIVSEEAPDFVKRITAVMMAGKGDLLPVSSFPVDGTWPTGTGMWEKRNIAREIPVWEPDVCIQCNKCAFVCPHGVIRAKAYDPSLLVGAPESFKSEDYKAKDLKGYKFTIQVAPEDCTGCALCVQVCPARDKSNPKRKAINMCPQMPLKEKERENFSFFLTLPEVERGKVKLDAKGSQFFDPLFEFSGACAGCGETPYIKLVTQLFGDRALIANATGCSSIYGGNLPTTPYTVNRDGRGPAWSNSLFEDNAEFGLGLKLAADQHEAYAKKLLLKLSHDVGEKLATDILLADNEEESELSAQRERVASLKKELGRIASREAKELMSLADYLIKKSIWIIGGDGWAYDIGFGGLDHVISLGRNVNILVLDTEVYSNTGGQQSKATPLGAVAKFATAGKLNPKKDLGMMAMSYGSVYVARIAFGAKDNQTVMAIAEAESYPGTSLIIAYSHCVAHGYNMAYGADQQRLAVESGHWPLYRFDPRRIEKGEPPLQLDSGRPKTRLSEYIYNETRDRMLEKMAPERARELLAAAEEEVRRRYAAYEQLAKVTVPKQEEQK